MDDTNVDNPTMDDTEFPDVLYENAMYRIQLLPDKPKGYGYGLVAARKIPKGTRILCEAPVVRLPREATEVDSKDQLWQSIAARLATFPPGYRMAYLELWNVYEEEGEEVGIALTNALPLGPKSSLSGVFLQASRLNHSCHPNAQETWNERIKKLTVHACCDIEEGKEITISYLKKRAGRKARQLALKADYRFEGRCLCSHCSLPPDQRKLSDARLEEIQRLEKEINESLVHLLYPLPNLQNLCKILELLIKEEISDVSIPDAYYSAFLTAISHGDQARAQVFAERALNSRRIVEGADSPMVERLQQLSYQPYLYHQITQNWKSNIEDAPNGFPESEFEPWLWRRERKPRELQFADLRCTSTFPCFKDLPGDDKEKAQFFEATDAFSYQPRRHWAFLGEILSVDEGNGVNLKLVVEDKNWKKVLVVLRTSEFEDKLDISLVKKGNTVVLLFPVKDERLEGTGLVVEKLKLLKILPIELEELLLLSDRVLIYSSFVDGKMACYGCDEKSDELWTCTRCRFFCYCSESCERVGIDKGHGKDCQLLSHADIRRLFRLKGVRLESYSEPAPWGPARECVVS